MKKWLRTAVAVVLCVLTLAMPAPAAQDGDIYFMSVNDKLLGLESSTMPIRVGGTLYVPYTMFSIDATGVNLGVYAMYSSVKNQVLVYSTSKQLLFDLQNWVTYEPSGKTYGERVVVRNSTMYLPIARVCDVFKDNISYTVSDTEYGRLIRVTNGSQVLTDAQFINAADNMMRSALNEYLAANPVVEPSGTPTTTPSVPPPSLGSGAATYLGFVLTEETSPADTLDALEDSGCQAVFFFSGEQLARRDDLIRELIGRGHFIGVRVLVEEDMELAAVLDELSRAQDSLTAIAHCKALVVLAEGAEEAMADSLEEAGYVCWQTTVDGREGEGKASGRAGDLMSGMTGGEDARNYLLLDDRAGSLLGDILNEIRREEYQFRAPVASEL